MLSFFQLIYLSATVTLHPFYISMTDVNYNSKSKAIEISVRVFTDDFEKTLRKNCTCKVDLLDQGRKKEMEKLATAYILQHLQIKVDGLPQKLAFAGYEQEQESTWNYFIIKNIGQIKRLDINNSLLHDYRDEQTNMLHVKANGKELTDKLDFPAKQFYMTF